MNLLVYTLGAAAKASGKSKATISKAIKSGRLSALKDEMGVYRIEPAELNRVYPFNVDGKQDRTARTPKETPEKEDSFRELQARLEAAHERLADKEALIADLREDRDRWRQQATALLADQRSGPGPEQQQPEPRRKGFWRRLFG